MENEPSAKPPSDNLERSFRFAPNQMRLEALRRTIYEFNHKHLDEAARSLAEEALTSGTYRGHEIGLPEALRNASDEADERVWLAKLIEESPELAETIAGKEVAGFHVTNSYALAGLIQERGLLSGRELKARGIVSFSGAHDAHPEGQSEISFGTLSALRMNVAQWGGHNIDRTTEGVLAGLERELKDYNDMLSQLSAGSRGYGLLESVVKDTQETYERFKAAPGSLNATMIRKQFPVAVGVGRRYVRDVEGRRAQGHLLHGQSYFGEFRLDVRDIPVDAIPAIAVPENRLQAVRQLLDMFGLNSVDVLPLEKLIG